MPRPIRSLRLLIPERRVDREACREGGKHVGYRTPFKEVLMVASCTGSARVLLESGSIYYYSD